MKIKKLLSVIAAISLLSVAQLGIGQTFPVNNLTASGTIVSTGSVTAPTFIGGVTGHASLDLPLTGGTLSGSLTVGSGITGALTGNASTATTAGTVTTAAQPAITSVGTTLSLTSSSTPSLLTTNLTYGVSDASFRLSTQQGVSGTGGTEQARFGLNYGGLWDSFTQYVRGTGSQNGTQTLWAGNTAVVGVASTGVTIAGTMAVSPLSGNANLTVGNSGVTGNNSVNIIAAGTSTLASLQLSGTPVLSQATTTGATLNIGSEGTSTVFQTLNLRANAATVAQITPAGLAVTGALSATTPIGLSSGGTGVTGFLQSGTGAVSRSWTSKNQDIVNARDYGVKCDGVTDDTANLNGILSNFQGVIQLPVGTCLISSQLNISNAGEVLQGSGEASTTLRMTNATQNGIAIGNGITNPTDVAIRYLTIDSNTAKSSGSAIIVQNGHRIYIEHITLGSNMNTGIDFEGGSSQYEYTLKDFEINSGVNAIVIGASSFAQDIWIQNGEIAGASNSALLLYNVGGLYMSDVDSILCGSGVVTYPGAGQQTDALYFKHVLMDTTVNNAWNIITNGGAVSEVMIDASWASSAGTGLTGASTENGFYFNQGSGTINGITISNSIISHDKGAGIQIASGTNISINSNQIFANSQIGSGVRSGVEVGGGVSKWMLNNNIIGDGGFFSGSNLQAYGLNIASGSSTNFTVRGNIMTGNITGAMLDSSANTVTKSVNGNSGYVNAYRGEAVITTGTSSATFTHGLSVTPAVSDILLSPLGSLVSVGVTSFWVSATTATTITVTSSNITTGGLYFTWDAKTAGN